MTQRSHFRGLRRFTTILFVAVLIGVTWYQRDLIAQALSKLSASRTIGVTLWMMVTYLASAAGWQQLVLGLGGRITYRHALGIWVLGNIVRYIPGAIWQFLGRVYLAGEQGVSKLTTIISILYEIALLVVASAAVTLITLPLWPVGVTLPWWLSLVGTAALVLLWPSTLPHLIKALARLRGTPIGQVPILAWPVLLRTLGWIIIRLVAGGIAFWILTSPFLPIGPADIPGMIGMYTFAWLVGYVTVFAPAGVGAADGTLAGFLSTWLPAAPTLSIVVIFRGLLLLAEAVVVLLALALHPALIGQVRASRHRTRSAAL